VSCRHPGLISQRTFGSVELLLSAYHNVDLFSGRSRLTKLMSIDMTNERQFPSSMTRPLPDLEMPLTIEEMEGLDDSLAFDLFLSDVEELQARQKGKGRQGCLSDSESSLLIWEEELLVAKQNSHDRRMALSMSNAIASDQNAMAALRASERIAERDRAIAFNMSGAAPPRVAPCPEETELSGVDFPHEDDYDTVSEVMSSLMGRVDLTSGDATNERGEASVSVRSPYAFAKCVSCLDQFPVPQTTDSPCGHVYCNACMKQLFVNATIDEELYPPRCCGNVIPADIALRLLDYKELQAFSAKGVECNTIDRVYCADISCSTFIPLRSITGDSANCPTCRKVTHTLCKSLEHPDQDCPSDEPLQQVLSLGESEGWRRCFNCRSMVELGRGCNHISCR
jgi:hypothetical protein